MTLAVHEACANIIAHSYQGDTAQRIDLTVLITPEELAVEIRGRHVCARVVDRPFYHKG